MAEGREVEDDVLTCIESAIEATREQNIDRVVHWLAKAIAIYEEHPKAAHEPDNHIRDLLVVIRVLEGLCASSGRTDEDVLDLASRAEALRAPLH